MTSNLGQTIQTIRSRFDPSATVVLSRDGGALILFGLRHFQLHLPEFDHYQVQLDPSAIRWPDRPMFVRPRRANGVCERSRLVGQTSRLAGGAARPATRHFQTLL